MTQGAVVCEMAVDLYRLHSLDGDEKLEFWECAVVGEREGTSVDDSLLDFPSVGQ